MLVLVFPCAGDQNSQPQAQKVGWTFNLILSIALLAVIIVAVVAVVKNVRHNLAYDGAGDTKPLTPTGTDTDGSTCSLAQQSCANLAIAAQTTREKGSFAQLMPLAHPCALSSRDIGSAVVAKMLVGTIMLARICQATGTGFDVSPNRSRERPPLS